jgi:hypothetical protein
VDDSPAVAAEVVVVVGEVGADRGEGLAGGASVHEGLRAGVIGDGVIGRRYYSPPKPRRMRRGADGICETSPMNIANTIDGARSTFEIAGEANRHQLERTWRERSL